MNDEFNQNDPTLDDQHERYDNSKIVYITRPDSEEPDDESTEEQRREEQEQEQKREEKQRRRESNPFWQFISGNWLILEITTGTYRYLLIVAATLFLSVVSIFYSFHLSERYAARERSVQLLRERSLEYQRARFNKTSHSAIVKELRRRNIQIYDLQESKIIIER